MFWNKEKEVKQTVEVRVTCSDRPMITFRRTNILPPGQMLQAWQWILHRHTSQLLEVDNGNFIPIHCITNVQAVEVK
jgi:hypothetical protein